MPNSGENNSVGRSVASFIIFLVMIAAVIAYCTATKKQKPYVREAVEGSTIKISYYRDCRTGICFAQIIQSGEVVGHTCADCEKAKNFLQTCQ